MFAKLFIRGEIELLTGMHIGTGGEYAAIGAEDSPVIKDAISNQTIIPGSSLKGKLRTVLARYINEGPANTPDDDCSEIKRLFGSKSKPSRLIFSDMAMSNEKELEQMNIYTYTEVKFENTINRMTSVSNPRQIERTIRGCKFDMELIYDLTNENEAREDIKLLAQAMKLLQLDYLGGHGSRGYGKIKFNNINADIAVGEPSDELMEDLQNILKGV